MHFAFKIALVVFVMAGLRPLPAQEKQPHGFLNTPFGATRVTWLADLKSLYKMKPTGLSAWPMHGSDMDLLWTSDNVYCLKNFAISDRHFTVLFYFNSDGKFYGFRLKDDQDRPSSPDEICKSGLSDPEARKLMNDVHFLESVFEEKFGQPTKVPQYDEDELCNNASRIFWFQKTNHYLAVIGTINTVSAGEGPKMYSTTAVIFDQDLRDKPKPGESLFFPEGSSSALQEQKGIKKAAKSF